MIAAAERSSIFAFNVDGRFSCAINMLAALLKHATPNDPADALTVVDRAAVDICFMMRYLTEVSVQEDV